jgi:hypothetical protein
MSAIIILQMTLEEDTSSQTVTTFGTSLPSPSSDLLALISEGVASDFKIKVGDKLIPTQKAILASSSPVFKTMIYETNMREKREECLEIVDFEVEVVEAMVSFIVTNEITEDMKKKAPQLMEMAHKYQMERLFQVTEYVMCSTLSHNNYFDFLIMAKTYENTNSLRKACLQFIVKNGENMLAKAFDS